MYILFNLCLVIIECIFQNLFLTALKKNSKEVFEK